MRDLVETGTCDVWSWSSQISHGEHVQITAACEFDFVVGQGWDWFVTF